MFTHITNSVTRKFQPKSYDANDQKAKDIIIKYLESTGHTIVDTVENYGVDIKSEKGGIIYYSEVEMKNQWYSGSEFDTEGNWNPRWKELRIPHRKNKLLQKEREQDSILSFFVIRRDGLAAWKVSDSQMKEGNVKEADNKKRLSGIRDGEVFFHIPYKEAELLLLDKE